MKRTPLVLGLMLEKNPNLNKMHLQAVSKPKKRAIIEWVGARLIQLCPWHIALLERTQVRLERGLSMH